MLVAVRVDAVTFAGVLGAVVSAVGGGGELVGGGGDDWEHAAVVTDSVAGALTVPTLSTATTE
jgi:hypothetical protein